MKIYPFLCRNASFYYMFCADRTDRHKTRKPSKKVLPTWLEHIHHPVSYIRAEERPRISRSVRRAHRTGLPRRSSAWVLWALVVWAAGRTWRGDGVGTVRGWRAFPHLSARHHTHFLPFPSRPRCLSIHVPGALHTGSVSIPYPRHLSAKTPPDETKDLPHIVQKVFSVLASIYCPGPLPAKYRRHE